MYIKYSYMAGILYSMIYSASMSSINKLPVIPDVININRSCQGTLGAVGRRPLFKDCAMGWEVGGMACRSTAGSNDWLRMKFDSQFVVTLCFISTASRFRIWNTMEIESARTVWNSLQFTTRWVSQNQLQISRLRIVQESCTSYSSVQYRSI